MNDSYLNESGISSAKVNAENVPGSNFDCFWTVQCWLLFSNLAKKLTWKCKHCTLHDKDHVNPYDVFKVS